MIDSPHAPGGDGTMFVLDSAFMAMALTLLKPKEPIHCIYEIKEGVDEASPFATAADLLLADLPLASTAHVTVPSPYFRPSGLRRFAFEWRFRKRLRAKIDLRKHYVGPKTSAIMSLVPAKQRTYIDHGTGDYYTRSLQWTELRWKRWVKYCAKSLLGFSHHYIPTGASGYTLCLMAGDPFQHLDYRNLTLSVVLKAELRTLKALADEKRPTLILPTQPWHSKNGFSGDLLPYDALNLAMVRQHCQPGELLFVKWHPALFCARDIKTKLIDILRQDGFRAYDVDAMIDSRFRGHIPAEIVIKHCDVAKVVAEQSSVFYNLAHDPTVKKSASALLFDQALRRQGVVLGIYRQLNPRLREPLMIA